MYVASVWMIIYLKRSKLKTIEEDLELLQTLRSPTVSNFGTFYLLLSMQDFIH
jgi:hypothetical protein